MELQSDRERIHIYVQYEAEDGGLGKVSQLPCGFPSPAAPRRSAIPPLFLCGPELRVIPKQSALIQGLRGPERSAAREPSPWPVLTHATLDTLYTR